ncbi:MAG: DUF3833 family protein [Octadecabacter sp.]|jgi:hypothetical protein|nr:DUF3833 family protein [Octadecabacter sp.]MDC1230859.1 DUF3833 domain-containing protein [Octadecabacter sp.]MDC1297829.1 DUF3833 domain-containing protein [Octadecabacter sp.]MDC1380284.1 DUF3833 domain-containing protein [Octadecabacter sp.]|tara:strand:+ start:3128 stop:3706 length:579 start_codon:yes stop_codon:yes gene_type:complete
MTSTILILLGAAIVVALILVKARFASFMAQVPDDYSDGPMFNMREVFNGPIECEGVIYGPTGRVTSRFEADFIASWDGNIGTVREEFRYDSGNVQHREWKFTLGNDGSMKAEAPDLVGVGTGQQHGSAVQLNYNIKLTDEAGGHVLAVNDWMYMTPNGNVMNRSQFRKFGIKVAELVATMRPKNAANLQAGE